MPWTLSPTRNAPADSLPGALRARNGHPEPFNLKYVEIGSENYGGEYFRRFELFRKAIKEAYPEITVISSSPLTKRGRSEWVDSHYYAGENFFLSNSGRFNSDRYSRRSPAVFIGEFGTTERPLAGTLRAAVAEPPVSWSGRRRTRIWYAAWRMPRYWATPGSRTSAIR